MNRRTTLLPALLCAAACGGPVTTVPPAPPPVHAPNQGARTIVLDLPDAGWRQVTAKKFRFRVWLPDAAAWKEVDDERWFTLVHPKSNSTLRFRTWKAPPRVTRAECLEQVYLWRSALRPKGDPMLERREQAPEGYDAALRIDLLEPQAEQPRAVALVVGATVRGCYAATYETSAGGPDSATVLAERLRLVSEGVFGRVELVALDAFATVHSP